MGSQLSKSVLRFGIWCAGLLGLGVQGPDLRGPGRKYSWFSALSASGLGFMASEVLVKIQVSLALFRRTPKAKCSRVGFKVRQL